GILCFFGAGNDPADRWVDARAEDFFMRQGFTYPGWPATQRGLITFRGAGFGDRKSTRLNSSHTVISYAVFCLKKNEITCKDDLTTEHAGDDCRMCSTHFSQ